MTIERVEAPERTVAERPFEASVQLANDGPAREVTLFAALYRLEEGKGPCGATTDGRFRTFTHVVQERVRLPANGVVSHPAPGARWLHLYEREEVPARPTTDEFCVFVAEATSGPMIAYEAFGTTRLGVRGTNAPPEARFSWEPRTPRATEDVAFQAEATDAEGDPVRYEWDFGHANASGRAVAEGARATHFFYPAGEYVVALVASDGLDEVRATRTVSVLAADALPPRERASPVPLPAWPLLVALALAACVGARRAQ